jgi:ELWxxDGT repeat protein
MKTSLWRRWCRSLLSAKPTRPISRARPRRKPIGLEALEDRVTPTLTPQMVLDINPGAAASNLSEMVSIGSTTYFTADDGTYGAELWKTDGTAAGTTLVKDICAGSAGSSPHYLTNVNGTLFFGAADGVHGWELWKTDGTAAGTTLVKDIFPGGYGSATSNLTNINGMLYFRADVSSQVNSWDLWKSDGTAAGTVQVSSLWAWDISDLTAVGDTLFFSDYDGTYGDELWKSDGTAAGTTLVKDIYPGGYIAHGFSDYYIPNNSVPSCLTNVNGTLVFTADDGTHGRSLWRSDGTEAGTFAISSSNAGGLANVNGTVFFTGYDGTNGWELWKADGTVAGTTLVKDISPGSAGSSPGNLTAVNGTLVFTATDGTHGVELWKSDGTPTGTTLVKDVSPGSAGSSPINLTAVNGTLFFTTYDGTGQKLWQSDGTEAGTVPVGNFAILQASNLTNVNGTWFFAADDGVHGQELWTLIDGQGQGSLEVGGFPATVTAGTAGSFTVTMRNADGTIKTSYRGTVTFTSSDPQAVLPGSYTFTEADQGVHTFTATLKTAGSRSVTVRDSVAPLLGGTQSGITVTPAAASRFAVGGFPASVTAGAAGWFTVIAVDAYGNRATGFTGTVRFTSSDPQAVLPGDYTFTAADAGTRTFSVTLKTAGYQSLTATDVANGVLVVTQGRILVNAAAASRLILSAPASVKAGTKFSLAVTVVDAYGNVVTGYRGTLSFRSSDATSSLPKNYTFTAADKGVHTFTGLRLTRKGKQTITVADTLDSSITGSAVIDVV